MSAVKSAIPGSDSSNYYSAQPQLFGSIRFMATPKSSFIHLLRKIDQGMSTNKGANRRLCRMHNDGVHFAAAETYHRTREGVRYFRILQ